MCQVPHNLPGADEFRVPDSKFLTLEPQREGVDQVPLVQHLWDQYRIIVTPIIHDEFEGLRVTPNLYTTLEELDRFCDAMEDVIWNGLPKT